MPVILPETNPRTIRKDRQRAILRQGQYRFLGYARQCYKCSSRSQPEAIVSYSSSFTAVPYTRISEASFMT